MPPWVKGALQLLINRYGQICFAQVPERVSTKSFVVLIIENSKSNHLGAQGTFTGLTQLAAIYKYRYGFRYRYRYQYRYRLHRYVYMYI